VQSVQSLYKEDQLPSDESLQRAVRRIGGWREMAASQGVSCSNELVVRHSPTSKDMNTEADEAVTRR
jgi:hypothetical protein